MNRIIAMVISCLLTITVTVSPSALAEEGTDTAGKPLYSGLYTFDEVVESSRPAEIEAAGMVRRVSAGDIDLNNELTTQSAALEYEMALSDRSGLVVGVSHHRFDKPEGDETGDGFHIDKSYHYSDDLTEKGTLEAATVVNVKFSKKVNEHPLEAYIGVENLFDENYEESYGVPREGRMIYGGLTYRFWGREGEVENNAHVIACFPGRGRLPAGHTGAGGTLDSGNNHQYL